MSNKLYSLLLSLFLFSIFSFISPGKNISDLIQPVNLSAGVTDSVLISDIFYAENCNDLRPLKNPLIDVKFNNDKSISFIREKTITKYL